MNIAMLANSKQQLEPARATDNIPIDVGGGHRATPELTARIRNERERLQGIPNFGNLIYSAYSGLALALTSSDFQARARARFGSVPRVYAAGYDWRRSNATSAARLKRVVDTALRDTGARQVILVAHSMGGLVSRWFARHLAIRGRPAASAIAALVLLGSPTHGAPQAYRRLKFGLDPLRRPGADGLFGLALVDALVTGLDRDLIRRFTSAYELLPTKYFCEQNPTWLRFSARDAGLRDASNADQLYANRHTGFGKALAWRRDFDAGLGCYMPNPTYVLYGDRLLTEFAYELTRSLPGVRLSPLGRTSPLQLPGPVPLELSWGSQTLRDARLVGGDTTVPGFSGMASGCQLGGGTRVRLPWPVEHDDLPMDARVAREVQNVILRAAPRAPRPGDFPVPSRAVAPV